MRNKDAIFHYIMKENNNFHLKFLLFLLIIFIISFTWVYYPLSNGLNGDFMAMLYNREKPSIYWDGKGLGYGAVFALYDYFLRSFNDKEALLLMYIINISLLFGSFYFLILRFLPGKRTHFEILIASFLWVSFYPTFQALRQNNVEITEIFFLSMMLYFLKYKKDSLAGVSLGIAAATKLLPIILILYFIWRRKLKLVFFSILTIYILLEFVCWIKEENLFEILKNYLFALSRPWPNSSQGNQAISGFIWRAFSSFDYSNRISIEEPIINDINTAKTFTLYISIIISIYIFTKITIRTGVYPSSSLNIKVETVEIAIILLTMLILLPHNHSHYFILISWIYIACIREWKDLLIYKNLSLSQIMTLSYVLLGMLSLWRVIDPLLKPIGPLTGVDIARLYSLPFFGALFALYGLLIIHKNLYIKN